MQYCLCVSVNVFITFTRLESRWEGATQSQEQIYCSALCSELFVRVLHSCPRMAACGLRGLGGPNWADSSGGLEGRSLAGNSCWWRKVIDNGTDCSLWNVLQMVIWHAVVHWEQFCLYGARISTPASFIKKGMNMLSPQNWVGIMNSDGHTSHPVLWVMHHATNMLLAIMQLIVDLFFHTISLF